MGRNRINGQYWTTIEDDLLQVYFFTGSTKLQQAKAINVVMPKLRMMGRIILERYYGRYQNSDYSDVVDDAICHFIQYNKFNKDKGSYYSYIGNSLKHYFHEIYVLSPAKKKNKLDVDTNYDINESQWLEYDCAVQPDFDEFDSNERQEKLQKILNYLRDKLLEVEAKIYMLRNCGSEQNKQLQLCDRHIQLITTTMQYFRDYYLISNVDSICLADYLQARLTFPLESQRKLMQDIFGIGSSSIIVDRRESLNEKRWAEQDRSYFVNDYCPNEIDLQRGRRFILRQKERHSDFDVNKYRYF